MDPTERYVIEPRQRRSRETLDRIVRATRELLRDTVLEELSVEDIARRAKCSVGTFYQRFPSKDAILPYLLSTHYAEFAQRVEEMITATAKLDLRGRSGAIVRLLASVAIEDRGLIRTLVLRNQQRPESIPPAIRESASAMLEGIYDHLLECQDEIRHPHPRRAAAVGLLMVAASIRERLILGGTTQAAALGIDADELASELVTALTSYLMNPVEPPARRSS